METKFLKQKWKTWVGDTKITETIYIQQCKKRLSYSIQKGINKRCFSNPTENYNKEN